MPIRRPWRLLFLLIYVLISIGSFHTTKANPTPLPRADPQLLSGAIVGRPVATGRAVFWNEVQGRRFVIRGYNLETDMAFLAIARDGAILDLAADSTRIAWVERDITTGRTSIFGYDLAARSTFPIVLFA